MSAVPGGYAAQLKAEGQTVTIAGPQTARWPTQGTTAEGPSPFATQAGADNEAARRGDLRGGPHVRESAVLPGRQAGLFGRCITLKAPGLGYAADGERVYVIGVEEMDNGTSVLTVVRRLS